MTTRKLVEADGLIGSEGSKLLAFIDTMEERGLPWCVSTNRDGNYKLDALIAEGEIVSATAKTIGEAVTMMGKKIVEIAMRGAPSA